MNPSIPAWVSEGSLRKYHTAIANLKAEKKEVTEEAVKALYILKGGLVLDTGETVDETETTEPTRRTRKAA